ncbi:cell division protein ZapA [bacterium SCSIO 12741]|nr:cell division protein ZapA [bacterium SCSIO 12741]
MAEKNITVKIANREYPLQVEEGEEQKIKLAVQLINENINKLKGNYVVSDYVDLLAMTALEFATQSSDVEGYKDSAIQAVVEQEMDQIANKIDSCLATE